MTTPKYDLNDTAHQTQGWNLIHDDNMDDIDDHLHTRLLVTLDVDASAYEAVYIKSNGKAAKARAIQGLFPTIGLLIEAGSADEEVRCQRVGPITNAGWSLTPGQPVFLSPTTPGAITQTEPPINCQLLGYATTATTIMLCGNMVIGNCPEETIATTTTTTV